MSLAVCWPLSGDAQESSEKRTTWLYQVSWGPSQVATLHLKEGCDQGKYRPLQLRAKSVGLAEQLHAFHIQLDSFVAANYASFRGQTSIQEDGTQRRFQTDFSDDRARVQKWTTAQHTSKEITLPPGTHDLLSWLFSLRSQHLLPGASFRYHVWDGWKLVEIEATVGTPEERQFTAGLQTVLPVRLQRTRLSQKTRKPTADAESLGTLWFSTGSDPTPYAMSFRAPIRNADIELQRVIRRACATNRKPKGGTD